MTRSVPPLICSQIRVRTLSAQGHVVPAGAGIYYLAKAPFERARRCERAGAQGTYYRAAISIRTRAECAACPRNPP